MHAEVASVPREGAVAAAADASLRYWEDHSPAIRRLRQGRQFRYVNSHGRPIKEKKTLTRIAQLAIPPAWEEVRICPLATGHLQATGRDAKGRKQYRYHDRWRTIRDKSKFDRLLDFARVLPLIRKHVKNDLQRSGLPREKVLATVVRLLDLTLIRIGNDEYAKANQSYGLTTRKRMKQKEEKKNIKKKVIKK